MKTLRNFLNYLDPLTIVKIGVEKYKAYEWLDPFIYSNTIKYGRLNLDTTNYVIKADHRKGEYEVVYYG